MKKWKKFISFIFCVIILLIVVDILCIFNLNKPLFAIRRDQGHSVNLVYKGLLYDTYICHEYKIPQIKLKGTKFNCSLINDEASKYIGTNIKNVSISISDISLTGATIIIKDTNENPYTYGEWYKIEQQINGKWYELKPVINNYGFNSIGYLPNKNNEVKFVIDWKWLYGELSLGSYRILKQVDSQYISVEFNIATTS